MILEWSRRSACWSEKLIESLCIAQCNHILLKLGLNLEKLAVFHFPKRAEITTHVHPVMKLLYLVCEKMTVTESKDLMIRINNLHASQLSTLNEDRPLEVHFLHCISQKLFCVFDKQPNLQLLIDLLKEMDNLDMYDFVKSNCDRITRASLEKRPPTPMVVPDQNPGISSSLVQPITSNNITQVKLGIECYHIDRTRPGVLLIINQFKFYADPDPSLAYLLPSMPLEERRGTEKDVQSLQKTFKKFNFKIVTKNDLPHKEILEEIKRTIEAMEGTDSSLFVAILSHGIDGCVYGSNSIPLEVREIRNQIYSSGDHVLLGRPKCLIVQACQGQNLQISRRLASSNELQTDSPTATPSVAIPPCSDFLIAWSTVDGFASLRHVLTGTWFIQTLCRTIDECSET